VNGNMPIDLAKFQPQTPAAASTTSVAAGASTEVDLSSTPAGAEISIDGNFVGNTPSNLNVGGGEHTMSKWLDTSPGNGQSIPPEGR
jgi:PEGA domain-containing protein